MGPSPGRTALGPRRRVSGEVVSRQTGWGAGEPGLDDQFLELVERDRLKAHENSRVAVEMGDLKKTAGSSASNASFAARCSTRAPRIGPVERPRRAREGPLGAAVAPTRRACREPSRSRAHAASVRRHPVAKARSGAHLPSRPCANPRRGGPAAGPPARIRYLGGVCPRVQIAGPSDATGVPRAARRR